MKPISLIFPIFALAACTSSPAVPADAGAPDAPVAAFGGGKITLAKCGHDVMTQFGAQVPVIVADRSAPLGSDPAPRQIHLSIAGDPRSSVVVIWRTGDDTTPATTVQYGEAAVDEHSEDGLSFLYTNGLGASDPPVRIHETHLCGLKADTTYKYRVGGRGSDGREAWSSPYTFRTAPDLTVDPSAQVTVLALGDTRGGTTDWGTILKAADQAAAPDLVLFTGDAVTFALIQSEWDDFFDQASPVLTHVPMVLAHGNHEADSIAFFSMNANPGNEQYFGLDYGAFHLTVLNDSPIDDADISTLERQFLMSDLSAHAAAPWKLVMHHKPTYSSSANHGSDLNLRDQWGSVFDAQAVDLVLSGHDHGYERTFTMKAGAVAATNRGTVYVVAGSAGADLYESGHDFFTAYSEKTENYVILTIRTGSLDAKAYRPDGTLMDSFALSK